LGFCLFVITALHLSSKTASSLIDELTSFVALLLTVSAVFSFMSIRTQDDGKEQRYERIADYIFMTALLGIFGIILYMVVYYF
jgi:hypothetical protein